MKRFTEEEALQRCRDVWGDLYEYPNFTYKNAVTKFTIVCKTHGEFEKCLNSHVNGREMCPKCNGCFKYDQQSFEEKANLIHNFRYTYNNFVFVNVSKKGFITCPIHGDFGQTPASHFKGAGCPHCFGTPKKNTEKTIADFIDVWGDLYDYSLFEYINSRTKGKIVCRKHGVFEASPNNHLRGRGCPYCRSSRGERKISSILEELGIEFETQKRFEDCKFERPLPFDFYIPDLNILIEFQGKQHYFPYKFFNGEEGFEKRKLNDSIKKEFCIKEGINLFEIKYNESIEKKMLKILSNIS
jgi:hypothetical protein